MDEIDPNKVVEVEVKSEKVNPTPKKQASPKKGIDDHTKPILFYGRIAYICLRYGPTGLILSLLASLIFSILASGANWKGLFLIVAIISYVLAAAFMILTIVGLICHSIRNHYMKSDPNYNRGDK